MKKKIKRFLRKFFGCDYISDSIKYDIKKQYLEDRILNCNSLGITEDKYLQYDIIVSLTTYGKRLYDVSLTIESIMQGTMKPNKIILWLEEELTEVALPISLKKQQKRGLEIRYCKNIRSYKKLIYTLKEFPMAAIITIDDDVLYGYDLVENLVNTHSLYPTSVIANRVHRIKLDNNNRPLSYLKWDMCSYPNDVSVLNFAVGVGGILYPPNCFVDHVFDEGVFLNICPFADDVWFYAMELLSGKKVKKSFTHSTKGEDYYSNETVQDIALSNCNVNKHNCMNDEQIQKVFDRYGIWSFLSE